MRNFLFSGSEPPLWFNAQSNNKHSLIFYILGWGRVGCKVFEVLEFKSALKMDDTSESHDSFSTDSGSDYNPNEHFFSRFFKISSTYSRINTIMHR